MMLKICVNDIRNERRLVLDGTLTGPWVAELRTAWNEANTGLNDRELVVDLRNVTFISEEGKGALSELMIKGAKFCCAGVLTKHVLQQLARENKVSPD